MNLEAAATQLKHVMRIDQDVGRHFTRRYDVLGRPRDLAKYAPRTASIMRAERFVVAPVFGIVAVGNDLIVMRFVDFQAAVLIGMALGQDDVADWPRGNSTERDESPARVAQSPRVDQNTALRRRQQIAVANP